MHSRTIKYVLYGKKKDVQFPMGSHKNIFSLVVVIQRVELCICQQYEKNILSNLILKYSKIEEKGK